MRSLIGSLTGLQQSSSAADSCGSNYIHVVTAHEYHNTAVFLHTLKTQHCCNWNELFFSSAHFLCMCESERDISCLQILQQYKTLHFSITEPQCTSSFLVAEGVYVISPSAAVVSETLDQECDPGSCMPALITTREDVWRLAKMYEITGSVLKKK